ncbi:MAG: hypothetical protein B0D92_01005 [Spirochaeta sp. LUC14_002_19_P3]|nr:MAG: hypothetical protein B0D92_01005 [Spirochaeta sp. LUC14_002_19_P3]
MGLLLPSLSRTVNVTIHLILHPRKKGSRHREYAVMLDHAVRKIFLAHNWIKRAEAERQKFEADLYKIDRVPQEARDWLDEFCRERTESTGSIDGYHIRRKAVLGWEALVEAWDQKDCLSVEDRIAAARDLQDNPGMDKFGDIWLYEALASAPCVWQKDGEPNAQILLDYVDAGEAEYKRSHYKVPAYRHPDPLLHPIFCDFGQSRWSISFDIHEFKKNGEKNPVNIHALTMGLVSKKRIVKTELKWSSKRLNSNLALSLESPEDAIEVSRATRLGRAAVGASQDRAVNIAGLFESAGWNGRLQAPRKQLEALAKLEEDKSAEALAKALRNRIKWFITFSPKLQPHGPWMEYAERFSGEAPSRAAVIKGKYTVIHQDKTRRRPLAKLHLCRMPGLRVLSVDLGHRHAAACAVWETLSSESMEKKCREAGCLPPAPEDLYLHLKKKNKTAVYRRIGGNFLPDGNEHPAPWAKLDRQFIIDLQGEEGCTRMALAGEIWQVHCMEKVFGRSIPLVDRLVRAGWGEKNKQPEILQELKQKGWVPLEVSKTNTGYHYSLCVDSLMTLAVNTVRFALRRHACRARIAYYMEGGAIPEGGLPENSGNKDFIVEALMLWYELATDSRWNGSWEANFWDENFDKKLAEIQDAVNEREGDKAKIIKQKERKELLKKEFIPLAEGLLENSRRISIASQWRMVWNEEDAIWQSELRSLRDWILPKGTRGKKRTIRHVGGLSLSRLAVIKSLYRVQKSFYTRMKPEGEPMDGTMAVGEGFGQKILDDLETMKEQRVKQLASRVVEAALGTGRIKKPENNKTPKRPFTAVDEPCHAVVIENLTHYRPENKRTRRENRQLMTWSSSKVKKYLFESCQLHGLYLFEVQASYTSRQDSRTGAPGVRCSELSVKKFLESPFRQREIAHAEENMAQENPCNRYLIALHNKWKNREYDKTAPPLRIPHWGGEIFVSALTGNTLQADLNAAANIGLQALLDPDWPGRWWYVPAVKGCDGRRIPHSKCSGAACLDNWRVGLKNNLYTGVRTPLPGKNKGSTSGEDVHKSNAVEKSTINLWRDISVLPLTEGQW